MINADHQVQPSRKPPVRRGRWRRSALLAPLVATVALALVAGPANASPDAAASRPVKASYENPLTPDIPGDGTVDSCADPTVLKGQNGETQGGKQVWYMYCTTDPLNDTDVNAKGEPIFHRIPTMSSTDLVNWTYVGDAFALDGGDIPAWIDRTAAFWAPEVVYSSATDKYYMFVTVTETTKAGGGTDTCRGDSAIGVAVSDTAIGPWEFADEPVVAPRRDPAASPQAECPYLWTFDPDVLGDTVSDDGVLYYGSYFGGLFATSVNFTATGATAATADTTDDTRIAIGNRYEGANVIKRKGWYYLFASATNCCNGALTGYSVFVGRSRSPLGPFVDREGNSFLDAAVGGTPFLTMNGNRWVGTGHNTVFKDEGGQWWTIYHAVDQKDPFFAFDPGFTKRPALLDPIDWVKGWPRVNGGAGASDARKPAPAAQDGQRSRYQTKLIKPLIPNRRLDSDGFNRNTLSRDWSWAEGRTGDVAVADGRLRWEVEHTDLYVDTNTASVLVRDAPKRDYVVQTKVRLVGLPDEGCCFNYAQAGLVIYGDDNNFIKLADISIWETRQTEFAKELNPVPEGWSRYGNTVVGPPGENWTYLRIVVEHLTGAERREAGGDRERYTAYTSQNGKTWVRGGVWTHSLGNEQIGLVSMGATEQVTSPITAEFDYVRVSSLKSGPRS